MKKLWEGIVWVGLATVYITFICATVLGIAHAIACPEWFPKLLGSSIHELEGIPEGPHEATFFRTLVQQELDKNYWRRHNNTDLNCCLQFNWETLNAVTVESSSSGDTLTEALRFNLPESPWENSVVLHPDGTYRVWETKDGIIWGYGEIVEPEKR